MTPRVDGASTPPASASSPAGPTPPDRKLTLSQKIDLVSKLNKILAFALENLLAKSCVVFSLSSPIRRIALAIASHEIFETASLLVILANCVFLAMCDPTDYDDSGARNQAIAASEDIFQVGCNRHSDAGVLACWSRHEWPGACQSRPAPVERYFRLPVGARPHRLTPRSRCNQSYSPAGPICNGDVHQVAGARLLRAVAQR